MGKNENSSLQHLADDIFCWTAEQYSGYGVAPQVCSHELSDHPLFSERAIIELLDRFPRSELQIFTMGTDPEDPSDWRCVDAGNASGTELYEAVKKGRLWLNLLWIDVHEPEYAALVKRMYTQLASRVPRLVGYKNPHLTLILSSPTAQVYYHFDAEDNMLWHIRGEKRFWLYPISFLERSPRSAVEDIFARTRGEELPFCVESDRDGTRFDLQGGEVLCWPHNSPHRIENGNTVNLSLSTSVETQLSERRRLLYSANRMLRRQFGIEARSQQDVGILASTKRLFYRLLRKVGFIPKDPPRRYVTQLQIDASAPNGLRMLSTSVHPAYCWESKACANARAVPKDRPA